MKKLTLTSIFFFALSFVITSQVQFDIALGVSPGANPNSYGIIVNRENPFEEFQFNLVHVDPQYYGSMKAHIEMSSPFFFEGGISYTQRNSVYHILYTLPTREPAEQEMLMKESESMILLPVNIGVSLGKIDVTSGLRLKKTISSSNELIQLDGFTSDNNSIQMGWQMGFRYGFNRTMIGVEYMGALNRVGEGMYVNGHPLEIMTVPGSFVFSLQYRI